jgi:hypothetical protein
VIGDAGIGKRIEMNVQTGDDSAREEIILDNLGKLLYEESDSLFKKKKRRIQMVKTVLFLISIVGFLFILIMWIRGTLFSVNSIFCVALSLFWSILLVFILMKTLMPVRRQKFQIFDTGIQFGWGEKRFLPFSEVKSIEPATNEDGAPWLRITKNDGTKISIGNHRDGPWDEDVEDLEEIQNLVINRWRIKFRPMPPP